MIALPLEDVLPEVKVRGEEGLYQTLCNLSNIYSSRFDPDIMYELFDNCYVLERNLESTSKGSGLSDEEAALYSMDGGHNWRYYPITIQAFLHDCKYVWGLEPVFDGNLIRRNFSTSFV